MTEIKSSSVAASVETTFYDKLRDNAQITPRAPCARARHDAPVVSYRKALSITRDLRYILHTERDVIRVPLFECGFVV